MQMEGMVTDLQLARDKQQGFEDWKRENAADKPLAMDLQVTVLTTGFWPSYKVCLLSHMSALLLRGWELLSSLYVLWCNIWLHCYTIVQAVLASSQVFCACGMSPVPL